MEKNYITKSDYIYHNLKKEILKGLLHPGSRLVVSDIANEYSTSSMPVREALKRLQQESLIEMIPHIGARVMKVDLRELQEITEVRLELESMAVRLATPRISEEYKQKLIELNKKMRTALEEMDTEEFTILNQEFHNVVYDSCGNTHLRGLITELWQRTQSTRSIFSRYPKRMEVSCDEHEEVTGLIIAGDAEKACTAFKKHKQEGFSIVKKLLERE